MANLDQRLNLNCRCLRDLKYLLNKYAPAEANGVN